MIETIIVEDEIMARKSLEKLCEKIDSIQLVKSFSNAEDALSFLKENQIELILLDIEMPGMTGIELLDQIPYLPQVKFTTSNKEYAYEAFEYEVTDFLKKPVTSQRFDKAIKKVVHVKDHRNAVALSSAANELYIKSDGKYIRLAYDDIYYFENVGDYIKVLTSHGNYIIHGALKAIDQKIMNPRFLKIHRSYIVNMDKIKDIQDNNLIINNKVLPVSRAFKSILMNSINLI